MTQCDAAICCLISNQVPEPLYFAEGKSKIVHSEFQQYTNCIFFGSLGSNGRVPSQFQTGSFSRKNFMNN